MLPGCPPLFFAFLSNEDRKGYLELRESVGSTHWRYRRNHRLATFIDLLTAILSYCRRAEADTCKRCLVCGIFPIADGFAVNTQQLTQLLNRSKSSINGMFALMGYSAVTVPQNAPSELPTLPTPDELRKW
jgi:hypothetical protein